MGTKAGLTFYYYYYYFFFILGGRTQIEGGLAKFWGKRRDGPDGGRRREKTDHQLWRFRFCGLEKKKRLSSAFFHWFFFYYLILLLCCYRFITVLFTV